MREAQHPKHAPPCSPGRPCVSTLKQTREKAKQTQLNTTPLKTSHPKSAPPGSPGRACSSSNPSEASWNEKKQRAGPVGQTNARSGHATKQPADQGLMSGWCGAFRFVRPPSHSRQAGRWGRQHERPCCRGHSSSPAAVVHRKAQAIQTRHLTPLHRLRTCIARLLSWFHHSRSPNQRLSALRGGEAGSDKAGRYSGSTGPGPAGLLRTKQARGRHSDGPNQHLHLSQRLAHRSQARLPLSCPARPFLQGSPRVLSRTGCAARLPTFKA